MYTFPPRFNAFPITGSPKLPIREPSKGGTNQLCYITCFERLHEIQTHAVAIIIGGCSGIQI